MNRADIAPRVLEALRLTAKGKTHKEVAQAMGISPWTARDYRQAAMRSLGSATMEHAVAKAARLGLLDGVEL